MQLTFTCNQTATHDGVAFDMRCDMVQSDDETARFAYYDIRSPVELVFDVMQGTTPDGMTLWRRYKTAQDALSTQALIIQRCRTALEELAIEQDYGGVETVAFELPARRV